MKKLKWAIVLIVVAMLGTFMLTACQPRETQENTFTVTYYDGDKVLDTETVQGGGVRLLIGNLMKKKVLSLSDGM